MFHTFHTIDSGISLTINDYIYYKLCLLRTIVIISTYELLLLTSMVAAIGFFTTIIMIVATVRAKKMGGQKNMTKLGPVGNPFTELVLRGRWPLRLKDHTMQHREKKIYSISLETWWAGVPNAIILWNMAWSVRFGLELVLLIQPSIPWLSESETVGVSIVGIPNSWRGYNGRSENKMEDVGVLTMLQLTEWSECLWGEASHYKVGAWGAWFFGFRQRFRKARSQIHSLQHSSKSCESTCGGIRLRTALVSIIYGFVI